MSSAALVIQTAFLGDVVLSTPLLSALAERHGAVDVVTTPLAAPLLETLPAVRKVFPYDKRGADRGWGGLNSLARRLQEQSYTQAYLPHRSLRSAALAMLARIPARIGFSGGWSFLYTEARPKPRTGHETDRLLALANDAQGVYRPQLRPTPEDQQVAKGLIDGDFVALAPGSIWGSKRWPYYAELAAKLGADVVVVGGRDDAGLGDDIVRAVEGGRGRSKAVIA